VTTSNKHSMDKTKVNPPRNTADNFVTQFTDRDSNEFFVTAIAVASNTNYKFMYPYSQVRGAVLDRNRYLETHALF
jgi:hypothetical protein